MTKIDNVYDIVKNLIGPIDAVGSTHIDEERFENLKKMTELVDKLLADIDAVSRHQNRVEYSLSRAGKFASKFFDDIGISN